MAEAFQTVQRRLDAQDWENGERDLRLLCAGTDLDGGEFASWVAEFTVLVAQGMGGLELERQEYIGTALAHALLAGYELKAPDSPAARRE